MRIIAVFSILGTTVGAAISFTLPQHYVSRSRFIVEPGDESALLMANRVVQESAFDRHALASLIRDYNLYPRDRGYLSQDALIKEITHNIRANAGPAASAGNPCIVDVQFDYRDSHVAERVNLQLMRLILLHNVAEKTILLSVCSNLRLSSECPKALTECDLPASDCGPGLLLASSVVCSGCGPLRASATPEKRRNRTSGSQYPHGGLSLLRRRPQFHFHPSFLQKAHQFLSISFDSGIVTGGTQAVFLHRYD
jgi:hypothetical protein